MSWRTIVISKSAKLDYKLDYLVIRQEEITRIHLSEVSILLVESTAVSLTAALLSELTKRKIKVIFCDEKRNPSSELVPYYGSHDTSAKVRKQIEWTKEMKLLIWTELVTEKIRKQMEFLKRLKKEEFHLLEEYIEQIQFGDSTNREGHAAKVYFNSLFGMKFTRTADIPFNAALNYGYSLLLSMCNREITANGYITQLGVFHDNMFNQFNLGSDLMEPFRVLVDEWVYKTQPEKFEHDEKMQMLELLNKEIYIDGKRNYLNYAIKIYCKSVFDAMNGQDISLIRFYRNEL